MKDYSIAHACAGDNTYRMTCHVHEHVTRANGDSHQEMLGLEKFKQWLDLLDPVTNENGHSFPHSKINLGNKRI